MKREFCGKKLIYKEEYEMKTCENCINDFHQTQGIYEFDFGWVCFDCYEKIRNFFDLISDYPKCEECGKDLINGLDMAKGICGQCWFDSFDEWEDEE
jgi:hypothetical protein